MIRVLICDADKALRTKLRGAVELFADEQSIDNVEVMFAASAELMLDTVSRLRRGMFDLVVCRVEDASTASVLVQLRVREPELSLVVMSSADDFAMLALEVNAGFFNLADATEDFRHSVGRRLQDAANRRRGTFAVKSPGAINNMLLDDVLFVESAKKGPVIHLAGEQVVTTRGTLQALYERFAAADAESFIKVGGSFIVNLDNIRSVGDAALIFSDGETIIAPVRSRKDVKAAYEAYLSR